MLNKILFVIVLGFFAGLTPANADTDPAASAKVKGRIIAARVQGHVDAVSTVDGNKRVLHDGDSVSEQTQIVTASGASIILVFSNGATLNLGGDSNLNIEQFQQDPFSTNEKVSDMKVEPGTSTTRLNLTKGELVGKVVHLNVDRGSEFTVETPVGAAGIRGTTFRIVFRPGPNGKAFFEVTTADGRVVFKGRTSAELSIPSGRQIVATFDVASGVPTSPLVLTDVPPAETAEIEAEAQDIETATISILFLGGNNGPNGGGGGAGNGGNNGVGPPGSPDNTPSLPAVPAPAITPGAGGP
jgi:hypothetical protein